MPLFQCTKAIRLADGVVEMLVVFDRSICELVAKHLIVDYATRADTDNRNF